MQDQIEQLLAAHADIYSSPKQNRISELESKVADLDFDGLHIGAPDIADISIPGIPILALTGNSLLRAWEVDARLNCVLVAVDMDRGITRTWPLYIPAAKKLKPRPRSAKPVGEAAEAHESGCVYHLVGETLAEGLPPGDYAVTLVEWDRASNIRTVQKLAKANPRRPVKQPVIQWPWAFWSSNPSVFQLQGESPKLEGETGLAVALTGAGDQARLMGSFGLKARPSHLIPLDSIPESSRTDIHSGIPVDLLQFSKNQPVPERIQILVPVHGGGPAKAGDILKGWFSYPLARLHRKEETLIYAFVDGMRSEAIRIPALQP